MAAGFLFDGYCHPTIQGAGNALALAHSKVVGQYNPVSASYHVRSVHAVACSMSSSTASSVTLQCSSLLNGSTSTTPAGAQTAFLQVQMNMGGFSTGFPSCEVAQTETDQIGAVNIVFGVLLGTLAVIWGVRKIYELLNGNARD